MQSVWSSWIKNKQRNVTLFDCFSPKVVNIYRNLLIHFTSLIFPNLVFGRVVFVVCDFFYSNEISLTKEKKKRFIKNKKIVLCDREEQEERKKQENFVRRKEREKKRNSFTPEDKRRSRIRTNKSRGNGANIINSLLSWFGWACGVCARPRRRMWINWITYTVCIYSANIEGARYKNRHTHTHRQKERKTEREWERNNQLYSSNELK